MNSAPATGHGAHPLVQPAVQPPLAGAPAPAPIPAPPQLRNVPSPNDPRGTKRAREEDAVELEPSSEPVVKQARIEPAAESFDHAQEALFTAIEVGDRGAVERLLGQYPGLRDAMRPGDKGETPLCWAARLGQRDIVSLLLQRGAQVDARSRSNVTPLAYAAFTGKIEVMKTLGLAGADPNVFVTQHNFPALFVAIEGNQLEALKCLASMGADLAGKGSDGQTVVIHAAVNNRPEMIRWLLGKGARIDEPDNAGCTALMIACACRHLEVIKLLLERGASLAAKNSRGHSPLQYAASSNQLDVVRWLLGKGARIDEPDNAGSTALMRACFGGHLEVVKLLLDRGASLAAKDSVGYSPLMYAALCNQLDVVRWLLGKGARIDEPDNAGSTALMRACIGGHLEVVQLLHDQGANPSVRDSRGHTCLTFALEAGRHEVARCLLELGVSPDEIDPAGRTPLFNAFLARRWGVIELLLKYDVNLTLDTGQGQLLGDAIFYAAASEGKFQVLISLLSKWWQAPHFFATSSDDPARAPAVRDLVRIFKLSEQVSSTTLSDWCSPPKMSARAAFIREYVSTLQLPMGPYSLLISQKSNENIRLILSDLIHCSIIPDQIKFILLCGALAGSNRMTYPAQQQNILLWKLISLRKSGKLLGHFSGKSLSAEQENHINMVLAQKLDAQILAFHESLAIEQTDFAVRFSAMCEKYLKISGSFDATGFTKALAKHFGIYGINSDRLTRLVSQAWETVRQKPQDLPPMATVGQAAGLSGRQAIESLLSELKQRLLPDYLEPSFPGFAQGLAMLEQEEQDQYIEMVFGQWRQISAALGQVLPDPDRTVPVDTELVDTEQ